MLRIGIDVQRIFISTFRFFPEAAITFPIYRSRGCVYEGYLPWAAEEKDLPAEFIIVAEHVSAVPFHGICTGSLVEDGVDLLSLKAP